MSGLVRILLGLVALASISSQAGATMLWKGGAGVVASTCSAGDFFTAVDGSGNFTCSTPSGSGDVTAVGDCVSGSCFTGGADGGNALQFEGSTANGFETSLTATDPTADRTVTLPNRTGTVALEKVVNLYDYAACDGTDEATGIQSAITAACALGPGGTLYVPADSCYFASTLTLCSGLAIVGSDSTERVAYGTAQPHELRYTGTGTAFDAQSLVGVRFAGLLLRASSASLTGSLIDADGASYIYIDRCFLTGASQAGAATSRAISANNVVGLWITGSSIARFGYHIFARTLSTDDTNMVSIKDTAFYQAEGCSIMNAGDTWDVSSTWWQQQGAADDESYVWCHDAGICMKSLNFSGNQIVDQPNGPTNAEMTLCGSGLSITGNFIGGNTTQDGILFDEACSGCSVTGNWFAFLDKAVEFSGAGVTGSTIDLTGNGYTSVTAVTSSTRPTRSIMQEDASYFVNEPTDIWLNVDTDADSGAGAVVIGSNATSSSATAQYKFFEAGYAQFRLGNDLRLYETDDGNYVQVSAPTLAADWILTLPTTDGATNDLLYNTDGAGTLGWRTPNAGTDITADLEEEAHCSEHDSADVDCSGETIILASGAVDAANMAASSVVGGSAGTIQDGTVDANDLGADSVSASELNATGVEAELEAALDHDDLNGAAASTVHTAYTLLAGRTGSTNDTTLSTSATGTLYGSAAAANNLTLQANSNSNSTGTINLNASNVSLDANVTAITADRYGLTLAPTTTYSGSTLKVFGYHWNPTINLGSASSAFNQIGALRASGTISVNSASFAPSDIAYLMSSDVTSTSSVTTVTPEPVWTIRDGTVIQYTTTGTATAAGTDSESGFVHLPTIKNTSTGTFNWQDVYGFRSNPTISAVASGTTTIAARYGVKIQDVSKAAAGGTETVTAQYGVDIAALSNATTNVGLRNADTTVNTPTTQAISANTDTIVPTATTVCLTSNGAYDLSSNPQISDGVEGQILYLWNCDSSTDTVEINDTNGLQLTALFNMDAGDVIVLQYMTIAGAADWYEVSRTED